MKKILILLFTIITLSACEVEQLDYAIISYNNNDPFIQEMNEAFETAIEDEYSYKIFDSQNSQIRQNDILASLVANPPKVLIINPVDRLAAYAIIKMFEKTNTPIIFYNREPLQSDLALRDQVYYVGSDAYQCIDLQLELITEIVANVSSSKFDKNQDGILEVVLLKGEEGHQDTEIRSNQLTARLQEYYGKSISIVARYTSNWSFDEAYKNTKNHLKTSNVEMIISNNDNMALGAIKALKEEGYFKDDNQDNKISISDESFLPVVGIDGIKQALDAIDEGFLYGTVKNNSFTQTKAIIDLSKKIIKNETIDLNEYGTNVVGKAVYLEYSKIN